MTAEIADLERADYSAPNTAPVSLENMPLVWIEPSPLNPRKHFDDAALQELADSIRAHGLLEALVVRPLYRDNSNDCRYIIIAGERRFRAAQMAGLLEVPVRILSGIDEKKHLELALIENLQRQDLDPLEEAAGYRALREIGYTQTQIAGAVHRSQPAIAKAVSLLELPADVQELIRAGTLSPTAGTVIAGRYRAFPAVASAVAQSSVADKLTTQQIEEHRYMWALRQKPTVAREIDYSTAFNREICKTCPFDAYRVMIGSAYCLRPAHYDELQAAAIAQQKAQTAAVLTEAKASGVTLPSLRDLPYGAYERFYGDPVAGCTAACPCRGKALNNDGSIQEICTNPKRYAHLRAAVERAKTEAKHQEILAVLAPVLAHIDGLQEIGPREMAALIYVALGYVDAPAGRAAAQRHVPALAAYALTTTGGRREQLPNFAEIPVLDGLRFALEAVLREEMGRKEQWSAADTPLYDWYWGQHEAPAEATEEEQ